MKEIIFSISAVLLVGCGSLENNILNSPRVTMPMLLKEVQCDLKYSIEENTNNEKDHWLSKWAAAYTLTLDDYDTTESGVSSLDWIIPKNPYPFTLGATNKLSKTANKKQVIKYKINTNSVQCKRNKATNFKSKFNFDETFNEIAIARKYNDGKNPVSYSYRKQFTLVYDATLGPGFKIVNLSGGLKFKGEIKNINTLDIVFAPKPGDPPVAQPVCQYPCNLPDGSSLDSQDLTRTLDRGLLDLRNEPVE